MKTKYLRIILVLIILLLAKSTNVFATDNMLSIETERKNATYGDQEDIDIHICWKNEMQAVGFTINYDNTKLIFKDANVEEDYYNVMDDGCIKVAWASLNDEGLKEIVFNFTATELGTTEVSIVEVDGMADGNLVSQDNIDYTTKGTRTIKIIKYGDINNDGVVDAGDSVLLNRYLQGQIELTEEQLVYSDVNLDGIIDEADANLIQCYDLDFIDSLPIKTFASNSWNLTIRKMTNGGQNENWISGIGLASGPIQWIRRLIFSTDIKEVNFSNRDNQDNHVAIEDDTSYIGTGTDILVNYKRKDNISIVGEVYRFVLYGDTTGDGRINAIDALALIKDINNKISFSDEIYREAGRVVCESTSNPTAVDALAIIKHANGKYEINK